MKNSNDLEVNEVPCMQVQTDINNVSEPKLRLTNANGNIITAQELKVKDLRILGLLSSKEFIDDCLLRNYLENEYGVEVVLCEKYDKIKLNDEVKKSQLYSQCMGSSVDICTKITNKLVNQGVDAIVTVEEPIRKLVKYCSVDVPTFDLVGSLTMIEIS